MRSYYDLQVDSCLELAAISGCHIHGTPIHEVDNGADQLFEIVERIDSFPYQAIDPQSYAAFMKDYYYFTMDAYPKPLGYVHQSIVDNITWPSFWKVDLEQRRHHLSVSGDEENLISLRTRLINDTISCEKAQGKIEELSWTGDMVQVLTPEGEHIFNMWDGGSQVFGLLSFGAHLISWTTTAEGRKYWLQRRSMTKRMHPGKLDTLVGGGIKLGETPTEAMIREFSRTHRNLSTFFV
ncbi:hypothetical protein B0T16DRAFT_453333 [Cercophora newfieldiana]|uniref:Nudix hydrolase domain-containing protein n=1 Tax=Cercophora newfieldiana TaxID=92897 RepID=A0AA39YSQ0_9PEZI|nr:hypothetical protein B0T16DRAFT_453333 [Cercophora newfieldiana]